MRNIKMIIQYDGARYRGWQRLSDSDNTIQQKIEDVLMKMTKEDIQIIGSGRTDAGVHAIGQVANFHTNSTVKLDEIRDYCNHYLPTDIVIKNVSEAGERFHARYNALSKKYIYSIHNSYVPTVFNRKYTYQVSKHLDIKEMKKATKYLIGEFDFKAFTAMKSKKKSTVREIYSIDINKEHNQIDIIYHGNGFLHKMIRIITGTLIEIGLGEKKESVIPNILNGKIRANAGITAPAQGLCLKEVIY
ncbi:tRNA pseudouridine(38-40) synthase TruA [Clostridiaceae bacterium M8S5]|nr:tRNA pseudouridine(38-40) synthase TruA [Clostridiaceae bacterium M8S5]